MRDVEIVDFIKASERNKTTRKIKHKSLTQTKCNRRKERIYEFCHVQSYKVL